VPDIYIPGIVRGVLLYSRSSSPSSDGSKCDPLEDHDVCVRDIDAINHLNVEATQVIWHQHLGHMHFRKLSDLHMHVEGIPKIALHTDINGCPSCWVFKIRRTDRGSADTRRDATVVGQGISMYWGFIVQRSKTKGCYDKLSGWNGETAYLIIADHFSDYLWGLSSDGKASPLAWFNRWFAQYAPTSAKFCYCSMYQSGELANNNEIQALLAYHCYTPRPTGGDAS
jgi:hypothetical protein